MITFDSHIHSLFSFDGAKNASPESIVRSAREKGMTRIALTDHLELNAVAEGLPGMDYDAARAAETVLAFRERTGTNELLSFGIEMGQIGQYPDLAEKYLSAFPYETVVGSVHNLKGRPDFCFWDMKSISEDEFRGAWIEYLRELSRMLDVGGFRVLAHLTYPLRYLAMAGRTFRMEFDTDLLASVLEKTAAGGFLLEVNSSGFRQGMDAPFPDARVLSLYRQVGGSRVCAGSDAHRPADIAGDFDRLASFLKRNGFGEICFARGNDIYTQTI